MRFRQYSRETRAKFATKSIRNYWPAAAVTAGLIGIGGSIFSVNMKSFLPTAFCECNDKCAESPKNKCQCNKKCPEKSCDGLSECLQQTNQEDEIIRQANAELETALKDARKKLVELTEAAVKAYCAAIEALKIYIDKVYCASETLSLEFPRFDEIWCDVAAARDKSCQLVKDALEKGDCAWALITRYREIIENGRACHYTRCNPLLETSEKVLCCAEKEFCAKRKAAECLMQEARAAEQFANLIEEFRRDLKSEGDSIAPEELFSTIYPNERDMILTHVYKKILRAQKEVATGCGCSFKRQSNCNRKRDEQPCEIVETVCDKCNQKNKDDWSKNCL